MSFRLVSDGMNLFIRASVEHRGLTCFFIILKREDIAIYIYIVISNPPTRALKLPDPIVEQPGFKRFFYRGMGHTPITTKLFIGGQVCVPGTYITTKCDKANDKPLMLNDVDMVSYIPQFAKSDH